MKKVVYPAKAKKKGIQGNVLIAAVIDEAGRVIATGILKELGAGCDEAALKALTATLFTPALNNGVAVKAKVVIPFVFTLDKVKKSGKKK